MEAGKASSGGRGENGVCCLATPLPVRPRSWKTDQEKKRASTSRGIPWIGWPRTRVSRDPRLAISCRRHLATSLAFIRGRTSAPRPVGLRRVRPRPGMTWSRSLAGWIGWTGRAASQSSSPQAFLGSCLIPRLGGRAPLPPLPPPPPQLSASPIGRSTLAFCGPCPARFFCSQRGRGRRWSTARGRVRFVDSLLSPPLVPATPAEAFVWGLGVGGQISAASDWSRLLS